MRAEMGAGSGERRAVQLLLRIGVLVGCLLMTAGIVLAIVQGRRGAHAVRFADVWTLLAHGRPSGLMALGLFVLLATPVARVLALVVGFSVERDWRFVAAAAGVACLLALGVAVGRV